MSLANTAPLANTSLRYGGVAKMLHWLTALLILTMLPLGLVANDWPMDTQEAIATKTLLFSLHKTLGVTTFFVALTRIAWALTQTRPVLLNAERRLEATLAETVHWLLYASLVIVPLSGWLEHSAAEGFAPIWWPFGQNLPLVPKDPELAELFASWHGVFTKLLALAVVLHVAGALKHHIIDRDATLRRMLPGTPDIAVEPVTTSHRTPILAAGAIYAAALAAGTALAPHAEDAPAAPALAAVASGWQVQEGTLGITIGQMGSPVSGQFADWTAAIDFSETATDGRHGTVEVVISIASLSLGSITKQAMGADFFDAATHPTATFTADILAAEGDGNFVADGTLTLKGTSLPLALPFTLGIEAETATMQGTTSLNRRDYSVGAGVTDTNSLADAVDIAVALTATRGAN